MKRLILLGAVAAAGLTTPGVSHAASPTQTGANVDLVSGVLTYTSGSATVDGVRLSSTLSGPIVSDTPGAIPTVLGAGCSALPKNTALCIGATSASIETLDQNDSIVNESLLPATLDAGRGNDKLIGGAPAETLRGGDGNDSIAAGAGADTIDAGAGTDEVDARDGVADTVDCGLGDDSVIADPADVLTSCEAQAIVRDLADAAGDAPGTTTGGQDPSDPLFGPGLLRPTTVVGPVTAHVAAGTAVAVQSNGKAPFVLGCAADAQDACTGALFIDPASSAKRKKARSATVHAFMARRGRYGTSPFRIRPGAEMTLQVKLTNLALRALGKPRRRRAHAARRGRKVRAVVTIAPKNARAQRVKITLKG